MHILGTHMHIHTKYEVSILNPVARRAVHRHQCQRWTPPTLDDNYAQRTNHDYIGSFGRIANDPKAKRMSCFLQKNFLALIMASTTNTTN